MPAKKVVPTAALQRALEKALGTVNSVSPQVEYLQELAKACPEIAAQVDDLGLMHAHLDALCRAGLGGVNLDSATGDRG